MSWLRECEVLASVQHTNRPSDHLMVARTTEQETKAQKFSSLFEVTESAHNKRGKSCIRPPAPERAAGKLS